MPLGNSRRVAASLLFTISAGVTGAAYAQTSKGTLVGVARDATGAVVQNAKITAVNQGTRETRSSNTSSEGTYRLDALSPGTYSITAAAAGFTTTTIRNVAVNPSVVTSYDLSLAAGGTTTEVTVEASQATVNTDNGQLAGTISAREMDKLPVFSLNPVELALTVPGVQPVANGEGAFSNGINIQVNGARPRSNNFLLDGQEINDVGIGGQAFQPQIPDIFETETVITSSASAEFGRSGGGIVNLVTKQGSNQFHGELFERYTGSGLNSVPGNSRGVQGYTLPRYDQHSFGFTAGGPIIKNKLFFFGAGEWQRYYGLEQAGVNLLPDAAGYATLQSITDPTAKAQVGLLNQYLANGSYLTQDIIYPTGNSVNVGNLAGCPSTGCVVTFAGFQRQPAPQQSPDTQWMYRVDYHPWDRDQISFRYLHDRSSLTPDFFTNANALQGFDTTQGGPTELGEGQWTHIFTPRLLNEFRVSEARLSATFTPLASTLANPAFALPTVALSGLSGTSSAAGSLSFASLGPNQGYPQGRSEDLYQFQDTIRWTHGRQSISAGADIGRIIEIDLNPLNTKGTLTFSKTGTGGALGNYLRNVLGQSGTATASFGKTRVDSHGYRNGIFFEDDIKMSADLTVNLGIRYDYLTNPENSLQYPGIDPNNPFSPITTVARIGEDYNNVGPRIGFAYSPHNILGFLGDGKTSIRGGFGVFYDSTFSNILTNTAASAPNSIAGTITSTSTNVITNATGQIANISPQLSGQSSVLSEATNTVNPLTYQYNLGVERELPGNNIVTIRYVGNRGEKLYANQQYNYFNGLTGARLNPNRNAVTLRGNYADSNYNGLEVSANHKFRHGLLITGNYVFSKTLDDGSEIFTAGNQPTSYSANLAPGGRGQDWGPSLYDHRHFFSVSYVYQIPGLHSSNAALNLAENILTRHWTVSGVSQLQSGGYTTFSASGLDLNGDGSAFNDRPIVTNRAADPQSVGVDGALIGATPGLYYDVASLNSPAGNLVPVQASQVHFLLPYFPNNSYLHQEIGRNSFLQPGTTTHNIALEKGFDFHEKATLILRAEAQNIANHNDATIGDTSVSDAGDSGFLQTGRVNTARTVVLWGKLQF